MWLCVQADALGQPCYVEVTNTVHVPFFEELGFRRVEENHEPYTFKLYGTQVECMRRDPHTSVQVAPSLRTAART